MRYAVHNPKRITEPKAGCRFLFDFEIVSPDIAIPTQDIWARSSNVLGWSNCWTGNDLALTYCTTMTVKQLQIFRAVWGAVYDVPKGITGFEKDVPAPVVERRVGPRRRLLKLFQK